MKLTFLGAAAEVTGSCYLVEASGIRFLVDCGLFQGRQAAQRNRASFAFDPRDRLLSYSGAAGNEAYDYDAGGMMLSSSTSADDRRFYYDASENPQAVNLHDRAADRWSAWLDHTRFLDDGKEQILLAPRKDLACSYDADSATLQSSVYDAFGASPNPGVATATYDLGDNPFRYAGEYRDPLWGGYYLRARWYQPDLPTFLSRDPMRNLNRYGYGGGQAAKPSSARGRFFDVSSRPSSSAAAARRSGTSNPSENSA